MTSFFQLSLIFSGQGNKNRLDLGDTDGFGNSINIYMARGRFELPTLGL